MVQGLGAAAVPRLALDGDMRDDFSPPIRREIARAYPARFDGKVLLRFPRLFIVAVR